MKITQIEIVRVRVPARPGAVNSPDRDHPLHKLSDGLADAWTVQFDAVEKHVLVATCDNGTVGLGESLRGARDAVITEMSRRLLGIDVTTLAWQQLPFPAVREYDAAESLVLDLLGKAWAVPAHRLLGGAIRDAVPVGTWSGHRTPEDAARIASEAVAHGFGCLKLKCRLGDDVPGIAAAVHDASAGRIKLIFDPNERFGEVRQVVAIGRELERIGNVLCLEDPIPRWDLRGFRELRQRLDIPIALHVALGYSEHGQSPHELVLSDRMAAADVYNLSAGAGAFLRMSHAADLQGRPYWHGSEVDLGILEAVYVHTAAVAQGCTMPSDIFGRAIREHDLLRTPLAIAGGYATVPTEPGLGVDLDLDAVEDHAVGRTLIR